MEGEIQGGIDRERYDGRGRGRGRGREWRKGDDGRRRGRGLK